MQYAVKLMQDEEGFAASVPGLPGCLAQGATEEEVLTNIRAAIKDYLEVVRELAEEASLRVVEVG